MEESRYVFSAARDVLRVGTFVFSGTYHGAVLQKYGISRGHVASLLHPEMSRRLRQGLDFENLSVSTEGRTTLRRLSKCKLCPFYM
jgi:hypothetical protein